MSLVRVAWKTGGNAVPKQGNRELSIVYDFGAAAIYNDDLLPELTSGQIDFVQSVFIDNSLNANPLTMKFLQGPQQPIVAPAFSQGFYYVLMGGDVRYSISTNQTADLKVQIIFSNILRQQQTWGPITVNAAFTAATGNFVGAGLVTAGGASELLIAANPLRKGYVIEPHSGNAESVFINFGAAAAPNATSFEVMPGGYLPSNIAFSLQDVFCFSVGAGMVVTAKELQ